MHDDWSIRLGENRLNRAIKTMAAILHAPLQKLSSICCYSEPNPCNSVDEQPSKSEIKLKRNELLYYESKKGFFRINSL